jgi:hypothetical protein
MGTAYNFIDESERIFLEQGAFVANNLDDLWSSNGTIATDPTIYLDSDFGSLKLTPSSSENYVRFNYHSSVVIVNAVLTSNVVTLTSQYDHGFSVGDSVAVSGMANNAYNGTFTITVVPTTTTFSYARTNGNIATAVTTVGAVFPVPSQYAITTDVDGSDYVESFMWVRATKNCTLYLQTVLTKVSPDSVTSVFKFVDPFDRVTGNEGSHTVFIGGSDVPTWHLIRSVPVAIPETGRWSIGVNFRVVFSTLTDAYLNIARPTAQTSQRFLLGDFFTSVMGNLPEIFLESDFANYSTNEPTYPLSRFVDAITTTAGDLYDQTISFEYLDASEGGSNSNLFTLSRLIDPRVCDSSYLFWLAQFRGRPILITYQPSTEGVGWSVFLLDRPSSLLDGNSVLGNDATNLGGLPAGIDSFARWQVETGYYGHNAGTVEAMVSAVGRSLTGDRTVNYTLSTNTIAFTTKQSETFGTVVGDIGSSTPAVLSLVEPARPLGMLVTHTLTA